MRAKQILLLTALVLLPVLVSGQQLPKRHVKKANAQTAAWRYEVEPTDIATQGSVTVKVYSFSKKPQVAQEQARKNAVHGVIFKGVPAHGRVPGKKALVTDPTVHEVFFDTFFADGGDYGRFVTLTNSGAIAAGDVMRTSNKEYKVGVSATVAYDQLRSYLESHGVVRKLGAGF